MPIDLFKTKSQMHIFEMFESNENALEYNCHKCWIPLLLKPILNINDFDQQTSFDQRDIFFLIQYYCLDCQPSPNYINIDLVFENDPTVAQI